MNKETGMKKLKSWFGEHSDSEEISESEEEASEIWTEVNREEKNQERKNRTMRNKKKKQSGNLSESQT